MANSRVECRRIEGDSVVSEWRALDRLTKEGET
jgi:hypothetical protein